MLCFMFNISIIYCMADSGHPVYLLTTPHLFLDSFVMSENYYVFLEQPLAINVATLMKAKIANQVRP